MYIAEYAVFGSKRNASIVKKSVNEYFPDKRISFFIENLNLNIIGTEIDGTPIVSLGKAKELYCQGKIKGVLIPSEQPLLIMREMRKQLMDVGIPEESIFAVPVVVFRKEVLTSEEYEQIFTQYEKLIQIYDLLFNITEYCNLNCRSCMVFSNLVQGKPVYELDAFERDVYRIKELIPSISSIGVLGGEPFLNKNLGRYVTILRENYPHSQITLTTNGILLTNTPKDIFDILRENNVTVRLSVYPPMKEKRDALLAILRKNNLNFFVSDVTVFLKNYVRKPYFDKKQSADRCTYTCYGIRDGRLARCEHALYIEYFNKKFGLDLPDNAGINIYDPSLTGERLMRELEKPLDLCAWCVSGLVLETKPWTPSKGDDVPEDYFVSCFETMAPQ